MAIKVFNSLAKAVTKLRPAKRTFMTAADDSLFSFAKAHPLTNKSGGLTEDGMILTHLTDFLPEKGIIDTSRSAIGGIRDSAHFAVNHGVQAHLYGNWNSKKYAILLPFKSTRKLTENKIVGGTAVDLFSQGAIRLPKDAVIVRYNEVIPAGKYRISDASKIKELKDLRGIRVVETSTKNMKKVTDNVLKKLGYEVKTNTEDFAWGMSGQDEYKELVRFHDFIKKQGMKVCAHFYTPQSKCEMLLLELYHLSYSKIGWKTKDGINFKKEMIRTLKYIEKYQKQTNMPNNFDIKQLLSIIKKSKSPAEAFKRLKDFGIKTSISTDEAKAAYNKFSKVQNAKSSLLNIRSYVHAKCFNDVEKSMEQFLDSPTGSQLQQVTEMFLKSRLKEYNKIVGYNNFSYFETYC